MRKEVVIVGMKTNEEADKAVLEIDSAVRESTAALDAGKVRPSASGLVRNASELVRDASGLVGDKRFQYINKGHILFQACRTSNSLSRIL